MKILVYTIAKTYTFIDKSAIELEKMINKDGTVGNGSPLVITENDTNKTTHIIYPQHISSIEFVPINNFIGGNKHEN